MKIYHHLLLLAALCAINLVALAQQSSGHRINLKNGALTPAKLSQTQLDLVSDHSAKTDGQRFAIFSFDKKLSPAQKITMKNQGILLLDYLSEGSYVVSITKELSLQTLRKIAVAAVSPIETHYKIPPQLLLSNEGNDLDVLIAFHRSVNADTVVRALAIAGYRINKPDLRRYNMLVVTVPAGKLFTLAAMPFVAVIEKAPPPLELLNHNSRNLSMAGVAQSSLPGGYNLTGEGVLVGIAEPSSSIPYLHQDYAARILTGPTGLTTDQHASHVLGTMAGAGNILERYKGYAPKASIVATSGQFQFSNSSDFFSLMQNRMVVSNNSYGVGALCQSTYFAGTGLYDKTPLEYPRFLEVFGAGNSGQTDCSTSPYVSSNIYPGGFNTILSYANSAKNTISVGAVYADGLIHPGSSRGPAADGRLKPDLTAMGISVASTIYETGYGLNTGTSMATPAVTGTIALLNEYYRRLHKNELPNGSLLKAVVCNSATDQGNRGPDFLYGYGVLNVIRAVRTLENQWHAEDSVAEAQEKIISISVPAGTAQLKVMLYWHDQVMGPLASKVLVNDLDVSVATPGGAVVLPYILNIDPAHVGDPATRGIDRLNNMEQVVIDDPVEGNYTITVKGTELGMGERQPFAVVYDLVKDEVEIAYPTNGDNIQPGETFYIQWYDKVQNTSSYTVEYSIDGGASWQLISNAVPATQRRLQWTAPGVTNDNAQIRVRRNSGGAAASSSFTLLGVPGAAASSIQCPSYFNLRWGQVEGATDYEVFLLRNGQMQSQGTTTLLQYSMAGLSPDTTYYAAVAARINGKRSLRSLAVSWKPNTGNCAGGFSDGDISIDSLFLPVFAREKTSTGYSSQQQLKIRVRNLDDQPSGDYTIRYRVNNSEWITEQHNTPVPGNSSVVITLATTFDLSGIGMHDVIVAVNNADDRNQVNDTLRRKLRQLENTPIVISPAFVDSFARSEERLYNASRLALDGMERYDYFSDHFAGRLSTGAAGLFASDRKELYLTTQGADRPSTAKFHGVIGTFNLSAYDTAQHDVGLTVTYSKMVSSLGQEKLFIRGNDTSSWIEAYLFYSVAPPLNNKTVSVNLSDILRKAKQNFSSSAQLMISQQLSVIRFSVSALRLFNASNDVELITVDSLQLRSYAGAVKPVHVIVRNNSRNVVNNIPVSFRVNNSAAVTEIIPAIAPSSSVTYKFVAPLVFERYGKQDLSVWVQHPGDSNPENDRKDSVLYNLPLVASFPYIEDFENGTGEWYVAGTNTSLEYGTPASTFINRAASGSKAFKTNLTGMYNSRESSMLSSPGFNLTGLKNPRMSISLAQDIDYCYAVEYCESLYLYHNTGGTSWPLLPYSTRGIYNWGTAWGDDGSRRWRVATTWLPVLQGLGLRFQFRSDANIQKEGIGIDNIHIYDSIAPIYGGDQPNAEVTQTAIANNEWNHFIKDGRLMASINTAGQDLGTVTVRNYKHPPAPDFHGQHYLRRHFSFSSDAKPVAPVTVRVYYREEDVDSLYYAKKCAGCTSPIDAHRLGVSTYVSSASNEYNEQLQDNLLGIWNYIPYTALKIVPFEDGYYAEFSLTQLGEVWLNDGGIDGISSLPMQFTSFEITQHDADNALLQWSSRTEINIHHFEIEVAKGNIAFQEGRFIKEAELPGKGRSAQVQSYNHGIQRSQQEGTNYYRIKAVDPFGNYSYSQVKPVVWSNELQWQVYPNPSTNGRLTLLYQASPVKPVKLAIFNSKGMLIRQWQITGNGFIQREEFSVNDLSAGVYMLRADSGGKQFSIKVIKQ